MQESFTWQQIGELANKFYKANEADIARQFPNLFTPDDRIASVRDAIDSAIVDDIDINSADELYDYVMSVLEGEYEQSDEYVDPEEHFEELRNESKRSTHDLLKGFDHDFD